MPDRSRMVSGPGFLLAKLMASRREKWPAGLPMVSVKTSATMAVGTIRTSRPWMLGRNERDPSVRKKRRRGVCEIPSRAGLRNKLRCELIKFSLLNGLGNCHGEDHRTARTAG